MSHLEMNLITTMSDHMEPWTRYVDDTITAIDLGKIQTALAKLDNFHHAIQFTCESELNAGINFLDIQLTRNNVNVNTTVYRKPTNSNIYIHWLSHAPKSWKIRTLKGI